jgi:hypothetical protein
MDGIYSNVTEPLVSYIIAGGFWPIPAILLGSFIVIANGLTCLFMLCNRCYSENHENHELIVASLSFADVINGVFLILLQLAYYINDVALICFVMFVLWLGIFVSQWSTVTLAVDRLVAIQWSLRYHAIMTRKALCRVIMTTWALGVAQAGVAVVLIYLVQMQRLSIVVSLAYAMMGISELFIVMVANAVIYVHLWRVARRQRRQIAELHSNVNGGCSGSGGNGSNGGGGNCRNGSNGGGGNGSNGSGGSGSGGNGGCSNSNGARIHKSSITVFMIVGLFVLLWAPYLLTTLVVLIQNGPIIQGPAQEALAYCFIIGYINSVINCLVYVGLHKHMRNAIKAKLRCWR